MAEKGFRGKIGHAIHQYLKDYDENKESSYLKYWDVNNLYGWVMSQKLPVNNFERTEDTSQFNEDFMKKGIMKNVMQVVQYPEKIHELHNYLPFLPEIMYIEKVQKFVTNLHDKN